MRIAVCISGICRGNIKKNLSHLRLHFPYDFYFATWNNATIPDDLKNYEVKLYEEPIINYHPIKDVAHIHAPKFAIQREKCVSGEYGKAWQERTKHHTKQILIHDMLLKDLSEDYDLIIRSRYDTYLSSTVSFDSYLQKAFTENIAIGFGTRISRHHDVNVLKQIPKIYPDGKNPNVSQDWGWYLMDPLIIHPRKLWNHSLVNTLHLEKKLAAAEWGWYQILSEPFNDSHMCVYGGAQLEKYL